MFPHWKTSANSTWWTGCEIPLNSSSTLMATLLDPYATFLAKMVKQDSYTIFQIHQVAPPFSQSVRGRHCCPPRRSACSYYQVALGKDCRSASWTWQSHSSCNCQNCQWRVQTSSHQTSCASPYQHWTPIILSTHLSTQVLKDVPSLEGRYVVVKVTDMWLVCASCVIIIFTLIVTHELCLFLFLSFYS